MKARKMGVRTYTDSLTPRRLSNTSIPRTANSEGSFRPATLPGRKEKIASHPAAMEIEIVST